MVKYGELDRALSAYVQGHTHDAIPVEYYRRVIKTSIKANNDGKQWDMYQAAAVLLYFAFNDGLLAPSQLTAGGLKALDHAEAFLQETRMSPDQVEGKYHRSANQLAGRIPSSTFLLNFLMRPHVSHRCQRSGNRIFFCSFEISSTERICSCLPDCWMCNL